MKHIKLFEQFLNENADYQYLVDLLLTLLNKICNLSYEELDEMYKKVIPVINHNYNLLRTL